MKGRGEEPGIWTQGADRAELGVEVDHKHSLTFLPLGMKRCLLVKQKPLDFSRPKGPSDAPPGFPHLSPQTPEVDDLWHCQHWGH